MLRHSKITTFDVCITECSDIFTIVNDNIIVYGDFVIAHGESMNDDWTGRVKGILKAELKRRNLGYKELAEKLGDVGIEENERNLANKIARGSFTAVFFVQCLTAIGCQTVRLQDE